MTARNLRPGALAPAALAIFSALAFPAPIQDETIRFDPARDLPRWDEASSSEFRDLYPLDQYAQLLAKEMDAQELAAVRASWKLDLEKLAPQVESLRSDPVQGFRFLTTHRLARDSYFEGVALEEDVRASPWVFLIQKTAKPQSGRNQRVVDAYAPWLKKVGELFEKEIAGPVALTRRPDYGAQAVVVLRSRGDFENYLRVSDVFYSAEVEETEAVYDPRLRIVVTFEDPTWKTSGEDMGTAVASMGARALLHAHFHGKRNLLSQLWLENGLVQWLVPLGVGSPDKLGERKVSQEKLQLLAALASAAENEQVSLHSLDDLAAVRDWRVFQRQGYERAKAANIEYSPWVAWAAFWAESESWVAFLNEAHASRYRDGFRRYLKSVLAGDERPELLRESLSLEDPSQVELEFWTWALDEAERRNPGLQVDRGALTARLRKSRQEKTLAKPEAFDPTVLALRPEEVEARHGRALDRARAGDLEGALAQLEQLRGVPDSPPKERAARDTARIRGALALRDSLLAYLQRKSERLVFTKDGTKYNLPVAAVEAGKIRFASNKKNVAEMPLSDLPIEAVAKLAEKPESQGAAGAWARGYVMLLCGLPDWTKRVKGDSVEASELRKESPDVYARLLRMGAAAATLEDLAARKVSTAAADAGAILAAIESVQKSWDLDIVTARRDPLESFARIALAAQAAERKPAQLLSGAVDDLGDGRIRLRCMFDQASEANVLTLAPNHPLLRRSQQSLQASQQTALQVVGGSLQLTGSGVWRLPFQLSSPLRVAYTYNFSMRQNELASHLIRLGTLVCDGQSEGFVLVGTGGDLMIQSSTGSKQPKDVDHTLVDGADSTIEIVHDGQRIRTLKDGAEVESSGAGDRTAGYVGFLVQTDHFFALRDLEIEGKIAPTEIEKLRSAWIEARLAEMKF